MRNRQKRPTNTLPVVEALKAPPVGLADLLVDRADLPVDPKALPVDQRGRLGGLADLLVGPEVRRPAKKKHSI